MRDKQSDDSELQDLRNRRAVDDAQIEVPRKRRRSRELTQLSPGPQPLARPDSAPDERLKQARARHTQARAALERGDLEGALAALAALGEDTELAAAEVALLCDVGDALVKARRSDAARALYGLALACAPQNRRAAESLAALPAPAPQRRDFRVGDSLQSDMGNYVYEVEAVYRGGMGVVCKVHQRGSEKVWALKTFRADRLWDEAHRRRFEQEALAWTELGEHPHIVRARRVERIEELPCLLLEYLPGGSLADRLNPPRDAATGELLRVLSPEEAEAEVSRSQALPLEQALDYALQCCEALAYTHNRFGLIHRDLKPQNCLIDAQGTLKVTDFGLARAFGEAQAEAIAAQGLAPGLAGTLSREVGTYPYMAPEQFSGATLSPATDVFSFGVMLWEMLSGECPRFGFQAGTLIDQSEAREYLPAALVRLVRACVADQPEDRPVDSVEVWRRLHEEVLERRPAPILEIPPRPAEELRSSEDWFARGQTLLSLGHADEALSIYKQIVASNPRDATAWNNLGQSLRQLARQQDAIAAIDRSLALDPSEPITWVSKGNILFELGDYSTSREAYEQALRFDSRLATAWNGMGNTSFSLGNAEDAFDAFERALELDPRYLAAWHGKATVLRGLGRHREALNAAEHVLKINPRYVHAWCTRGAIFHELGQTANALPNWERALELDPRYAMAWHGKAVVLSNLDRQEEALAACERALEIDPRFAIACSEKGYALLALGRNEEALAACKCALEIDPRIAAAWNNMGCALYALGRQEEALAAWERALEIDPRYASAWNNLSSVLSALGRKEEAQAAHQRALEIDPGRANAVCPQNPLVRAVSRLLRFLARLV